MLKDRRVEAVVILGLVSCPVELDMALKAESLQSALPPGHSSWAFLYRSLQGHEPQR
jgi:hypothetical protein